MDSTSARLHALSGELQDIKMSLQFIQTDADDIKTDNVKQTERCSSLQSDVFQVCDSLLAVTNKMEYLEGQSRRNNLLTDWIEESSGETWAETEENVKIRYNFIRRSKWRGPTAKGNLEVKDQGP